MDKQKLIEDFYKTPIEVGEWVYYTVDESILKDIK